MIPWWRCTC